MDSGTRQPPAMWHIPNIPSRRQRTGVIRVFCHECRRTLPIPGTNAPTTRCPACSSPFVELVRRRNRLRGLIGPRFERFYSDDEDLDAAIAASVAEEVPYAKPTCPVFMGRLPVIKVDHGVLDEEEGCVICTSPFELGQCGLRLPCDHYYHNDCIKSWLRKMNTCPICRVELPELNRTPGKAGRWMFFDTGDDSHVSAAFVRFRSLSNLTNTETISASEVLSEVAKLDAAGYDLNSLPLIPRLLLGHYRQTDHSDDAADDQQAR